MNDFYRKNPQQITDLLKMGDRGLHNVKVKIQREKFGYNELEEAISKSAVLVFFEQFKDFLVLMLLAAVTIPAFLGKLESTLVILVIIIINAILGTVQHIKTEQSLKGLRALSSPTARVLRSEKKMRVPSRKLLVGNICYLDTGNYVSVNGRTLESYNLQVNESLLTGESESIVKAAGVIDRAGVTIGDRKNMAFSGDFVTYGRAVVLVTNIGVRIEIGRIARLLESAKEEKTPPQESLDYFGKKLAFLILVASAFVFLLDLFRGREFVDSFMFTVSPAVAATPETLSSIVTTVLALGTQEIAKASVIIRKLQVVGNSESIPTICSGRVGAPTQSKMTVQKVFVDDKVVEHNKLDPDQDLGKKLVLMALLCNDTVTVEKKEVGDPTEIVFVNLGEFYYLDELLIRKTYPRFAELPLDFERKPMSTVNTLEDKTLMITKGALDVLLSKLAKLETSDGVQELTVEHKQEIERINRDFSGSDLRVLASVYKELPEGRELWMEDEKDLIFVGLTAMMDPPKAESAQAVADCISARVRPVVITGDHKITASTTVKQIGTSNDELEAIEGFELESMTDEVLKKRVEDISVYTRISPERRIWVVRA